MSLSSACQSPGEVLFNRALPAELFHPIYTFSGRGQSHTNMFSSRAHTHTHAPQCSCNPARFIIVGVILCPPLREELGEFKLWPTYTLLHFALCSAHKAQCMTSAHTLMFELSEQMALKIKTQNKTSSKKKKNLVAGSLLPALLTQHKTLLGQPTYFSGPVGLQGVDKMPERSLHNTSGLELEHVTQCYVSKTD